MNIVLLSTLAVTLAGFTLIWLIHVWLRDAGIVDYYWGPGFAVIGWMGVAFGEPATAGELLFVAAVTLWALRLAVHLIRRHFESHGEDPRYAAMRRNGGPKYWWQSLYKVFLMQAVILWIAASPVHLVTLAAVPSATTALSPIGYAIFLFGLAVETLADRQLAVFRRQAQNGKGLFDRGLWAVSRHPNYLGELILWFGLAIVAYDLSGSLLAFVGPLLLTAVMRGVSLPLTERHLNESRASYGDYCRRVPPLLPIPLRPRSPRSDPAQ